MIRSFRRASFIVLILAAAAAVAHMQSLDYPKPRKADVVDDYFGTKVADPYRWMEDLNAPEVKQWVDGAERRHLQVSRRAAGARGAAGSASPSSGTTRGSRRRHYKGGRWFYTRNTGLQRQAVVFTRDGARRRRDGRARSQCLSPDGSIALSGFVPSPDAQALRLRPVGGRIGLVHVLRARARRRQAAAGRRSAG